MPVNMVLYGMPMANDNNHFQSLMDAASLHQAGRLAEAEAVYRELLLDNTNDVNALHLLGVLAHQSGNSVDALNLLGKAVEIAPGIPMIHNNLGRVLLDMNRPDAALEHLLLAAQNDPERLPPLYNLAECYRMQGRLREATDCLQVLLDREPGHIDALISMGKVAFIEKRYDAAREFFLHALHIDAENLDAWFALSRVQFACRQFADSAASLERLLLSLPEHVPALNNLGNTCMELQHFNAASMAYRKAVVIDPDNTGIRYNLALALIQQQRFEAALPHLEHARGLAPGNAQIQQLLQRVQDAVVSP
jgi:tetratricopeptide (TPR) repeat protein